MTPVDQVRIDRFVQDVARPGRRYRARIGRGRVIEIQDGRVFDGHRTAGARCLTWAQKRIVAIEEIRVVQPDAVTLAKLRKTK